MKRVIWVLCLAGCGGAEPPAAAQMVAVEGDWSLSATETAGTCPVEGSVFPIGPGLTTVRAADGLVELSNGGELFTYAARGREWQRDRSVQLDGCEAAVTETWLIHSAAGRRLSASFALEVDVRGDCSAYGLSDCSIRYGVWGVQP